MLSSSTQGTLLAEEPKAGRAVLEVSSHEATVGDPLQATLTVELPPGTRIEPPDLGATLGPFAVLSGSWQGPSDAQDGVRWIWSGKIAAYEPGSLDVPAIEIRLESASGEQTIRTEPLSITIKSVLPAEEKGSEAPALSDLKPPASIAADYRPLEKALAVLLVLLGVSALAWWLHGRYASRLAAVPAPTDPFHRLPPHVWAYGELKRLLERRLAEEGKVDLFFDELGRILKTYLGGRYRIELMEHTTEEVVPLLRQAGAPTNPVFESRVLLERCDLAKFARLALGPDACRKAVGEAYRIVDVTKSIEEAPPEAREKGAA